MLKFSAMVAAGAFALVPVSGAMAGERVVDFLVGDQKVVGTFNVPDGVTAPPVVLLLHGFSGTRDELPIAGIDEGVFAFTARKLADDGIASLRIDFRGSGESDGEWADTTFSGQTKDALHALDWLKGQQDVDASRIAIVAWSQGGLVGAQVAQQRPEIKAVSLWAPVVDPMATYGHLLGAELVQTALAGDADTVHVATLPWGVETQLKGSFFAELPGTDTAAAIAGYAGPLQVIVGAQDDLVFPQPEMGERLIASHEGVEELDVFETEHVWGAFEGPEMMETNVVPAVIAWLDSYL